MQFRQFTRGQKRWLGAMIFLILYFWMLEIVTLSLVAKDVSIPPMVIIFLFPTIFVMWFLLLLIFEHDRTVMDAFLKTRPVSQIQWNRFLVVSHFWNPLNLLAPLALVPACFWVIPFPTSLGVFLGVYLTCVLAGILVMQLKRRGKYQKEKTVSTAGIRTFKGDRVPPVFGLQVKSLLRSKRLWMSILVFSVLALFNHYMMGSEEMRRLNYFWLFLYFFFIATNVPQFGLGIEANFISGIWTRPVSIYRILRDKYRLSALLTGIAFLVCLPVCLLVGTPLYFPLSFALLCSGLGALTLLVDAPRCVPFDLFGKTFFNYQGSAGAYKISTFVSMGILMAAGGILPNYLPIWLVSLIFAGLGLIGFAIHRPVFRRVERNFIKNKYKYLESYLSK